MRRFVSTAASFSSLGPTGIGRRVERTVRGLLRLLAASLLLVSGVAAEARGIPELVVVAPPELAPVADRLRQVDAGVLIGVVEFLGVAEPGPPIRIVLAGEGSFLARNAPGWVSGYANGESGEIVLFPARGLVYPDGSLAELVAHEVAHILLARRVGRGRLPRWFNEGLAMAAGSGWGLNDRSQLTLALVRGGKVEFASLDGWFGGPAPQVRRAYAISGAFVRDLLRRNGRDAIGTLLDDLATGADFDSAFDSAFGVSPQSAEASFWRRFSFFYRWLPFLTSSALLWILISLLALVAFKRRQTIDAEVEFRWQQEELARNEAAARRSGIEASPLEALEDDDEPVN